MCPRQLLEVELLNILHLTTYVAKLLFALLQKNLALLNYWLILVVGIRQIVKGVKGSVCQGWVVQQNGTTNSSVVSTPLSINLLSLASPSRHLDSN